MKLSNNMVTSLTLSTLADRVEIEKQKAHERFMKLQEQGKTEQSRKDLGNYWILNIITNLCFYLFHDTSLKFLHNFVIARRRKC